MLKFIFLFLLLIFLFLVRRALIPVVIGVVIAYVLNPYVDWLQKKIPRYRLICVLLAYLTVMAAAALLAWGFADIISGKIASGSLQEAFSTLKSYYLQYKDVLTDYIGLSLDSPDLPKLVQRFGSGIFNLLIGMVAGIYLLNDKDFFLRMGSQLLHLFLPQKVHGIIRELLFDINEVIGAFVRGVCVDSVIVAFLSSLALSVLGVDYAVLIGCFAGIANVIPYFGPVLGMIPAFFSALTESGLFTATMAVAALFAVQQIECNLIYPRIIGKSTGLHPLFVLIAVSVAGSFGGFLWMILAVPAAGIAKVLMMKWAEAQ